MPSIRQLQTDLTDGGALACRGNAFLKRKSLKLCYIYKRCHGETSHARRTWRKRPEKAQGREPCDLATDSIFARPVCLNFIQCARQTSAARCLLGSRDAGRHLAGGAAPAALASFRSDG